MSGNVTLVSTDPQEVVDRVLQVKEAEEPTFGEVAPESDETSADSPAALSEIEPKPSKRSQKVKRLAEKLTEAERDRDEWRRKAESGGREERPKPQVKQADPSAYPVPEPNYEDFPDPKDFVKATVKHDADRREWEKEQAKQAESFREIQHAHKERVEDARDKYEDFDEVMENQNVNFRDKQSQSAFDTAIREDEDGPEILYYLAKHPDIAENAFAELSPAQVIAKVGRIAASLEKVNSPEPQKAAPRLINPVGGGSKQPDVADKREDMPHSEWKKLRKAGKIR